MRSQHLLTIALAASAAAVLAAQTAPPQPPAPPPQQPGAIAVTIGPMDGRPPRLAVPEFIPLGQEADVVKAAKTIGQVLYDDIAYEKEFYMIPRDVMKTVPLPPSADAVSLERWRDIGADGVVVGTVRRSGDGVVVEARLVQVGTGRLALGKQYSGTLKSLADGGRVYAHTFADELHQQQRNIRGIARTKLAYSSNRAGEKLTAPVRNRDVSNIYISDYDGHNERRITVYPTLDISPVWSPDGQAIAYTSYRNNFPDIFISYIYQGKLERPAGGGPDVKNYLPAWAPDGQRLAYMSATSDGNTEIYVMNKDGSGRRRVTNHPMADSTPTWAPSGTQIAFVSDRTGSPQIYVVDVDGTRLERISRGAGEGWCDRPTWSAPPLNQIAYTCRGGGGYQIIIYDVATGMSRPISDGIGSNESPAFAPNGRHIAFVSDRTGQPQIYTMHHDGTGLRQITRSGASKYPSWSH